MGFAPAIKEKSKARIVLSGPSGAGKTFTALCIAHGMGAKIAVLDTENGSARKNAGLMVDGIRLAFDVDEIKPPYTADKLIQGIRNAAGYDVLIIDSLFHFWKGLGGILDLVDATAEKVAARNTSGKRDGFAAWKEGDRVYREYTDAILQSPMHVIATLRAKQAYEKEEGTKKIVKLGMAPEYREGGEYEFDLEGVLDMDHRLAVGKSRIHRADGTTLDGAIIRRPGLSMGRSILAWCEDGGAPAVAAPAPTPPVALVDVPRVAVEAPVDVMPAISERAIVETKATPAELASFEISAKERDLDRRIADASTLEQIAQLEHEAKRVGGNAEDRAELWQRIERQRAKVEAGAPKPEAPKAAESGPVATVATAEQNLAAAKAGPGTLAARFEAAKSLAELNAIAASAKSTPPAEREAAKGPYRAAKERLERAAGVAA